MEVKDIGQAGLVGLRGRLGARFADEVGRRTPVSRELVASAIGLYLFVSRTRRMIEMLQRLRRAG